MSRATALERARLQIAGEHGDLVLADGRLTITKRAPAASQVTVGLHELRGTVLVARRAGGRGWLHVNAVGGSPTPAGELVAMTDPYAVRITGRTAGAAKRLARLVHEHLRARGMPSEPDQATEPPDGRYSSAVMVTDAVPETDAPDVPDARDTPEGPDAPAAPVAPDERVANGDRAEQSTRQLAQLTELHTSGALTDEEFGRLRERVLDGHSGRSIDGWRRSAEPRR